MKVEIRMTKKELIDEVQQLYMKSDFNEFAQWVEETFYDMIPYLPKEKLSKLKKDLQKIQGSLYEY